MELFLLFSFIFLQVSWTISIFPKVCRRVNETDLGTQPFHSPLFVPFFVLDPPSFWREDPFRLVSTADVRLDALLKSPLAFLKTPL